MSGTWRNSEGGRIRRGGGERRGGGGVFARFANNSIEKGVKACENKLLIGLVDC